MALCSTVSSGTILLEDFGQRAAAAPPLEVVAAVAAADSPPPDRNLRLRPLALPGTPSL